MMSEEEKRNVWTEIEHLREELNILREKKQVLSQWSTEIRELATDAQASIEQIKELAVKVGVVFNE